MGWRRQPWVHVCSAAQDVTNLGALLAVCLVNKHDAPLSPSGLEMATHLVPINVLNREWEFEKGQCGVVGR